MQTFVDYIKFNPTALYNRAGVIDLFSYKADRPVYPEKPKLKNGIVFAKKPTASSITYGYYEGETFHELEKNQYGRGPFHRKMEITIKPGDLANVSVKINTTVGRFLINKLLLADPFGDTIPYVNEQFNIGKIEHHLGKLMLEDDITVEQYKSYVRNGYAISHMGDVFVPGFTEKALMIDKKIIKRRDELLEKHKDELNDPIVVAAIEKELVDMYKEYIKGDPAEDYFNSIGKKALNNHIKTLHIMVGGVFDFGDISGDVITIPKSLEEGWDIEHFDKMANAIRKGFYLRGKETANAGALTKLIFRAFQDIEFKDDDCKSKSGIEITFNDVTPVDEFLGRNVITSNGITTITMKNMNSFKGKTVKLRSPMTCKAKDHICYTCAGENFKKLKISYPGTLVIDISSTFMQKAMKGVHDATVSVNEFDYIKYFATPAN